MRWLERFSTNILGIADPTVLEKMPKDPSDIESIKTYITEAVMGQLTLIDSVAQPTQRQALKWSPKRSDHDQARRAGYPLPHKRKLQRDFIKIEQRKEKLAQLRAAGNIEALASYEEDCFNAIYASVMGFRPAKDDPEKKSVKDNHSLPDVATSRSHGCGGAMIKCAHWIKELGLRAVNTQTLESSLGTDGHLSFFAINARDEVHFFDPAMRVPYQKVPDNFFHEKDFTAQICAVEKGEIQGLQLHATDPTICYEQDFPVHVVVQNHDEGVVQTLLEWTVHDTSLSESELDEYLTAMVERKMPGRYISGRKLQMLFKNGEKEEARKLAQQIYDDNPNVIAALHLVGHYSFLLGELKDINMGLECLQQLVTKTLSTSKLLLAGIAKQIETTCQVGRYSSPVLLRFGLLGENFERCFDLLVVALHYIQFNKNKTVAADHVRSLVSFGADIFDLYTTMVTAFNKFMRARVISEEHDAAINESIGKATRTYARVKEQATLSISNIEADLKKDQPKSDAPEKQRHQE